MTIMSGNMAAGRHGAGTVAESYHLEISTKPEKDNWEC